MDGNEFVDAIKLVVRDRACEDTISIAESPPGRRVSLGIKARADWLKSLNDADRKMVESIIKDGVDNAIFGLFCVVDGVRTIEDAPDKGNFELRYVKGGVSAILNPADAPLVTVQRL